MEVFAPCQGISLYEGEFSSTIFQIITEPPLDAKSLSAVLLLMFSPGPEEEAVKCILSLPLITIFNIYWVLNRPGTGPKQFTNSVSFYASQNPHTIIMSRGPLWKMCKPWWKKVKGLNDSNNKTKPHRHRQQHGDYQRKGGWEEVEQGKWDEWRWKENWLWMVNTQYNIQVIYYRILHLKPR